MHHEIDFITVEDWKGPKLKGSVVYLKEACEASYGFIRPVGGTSRDDNIWFGQRAMQGQEFRIGDEVRYALARFQRSDKPNLSAIRAWVMAPADDDDDDRNRVTTIHGELEF